MESRRSVIEQLTRLKEFFLYHNVSGWVQRVDVAVRALSRDNADTKEILHDFIGAGMGSLTDLYICVDNDHSIPATEKEANAQLAVLVEQLLKIQYGLERWKIADFFKNLFFGK